MKIAGVTITWHYVAAAIIFLIVTDLFLRLFHRFGADDWLDRHVGPDQ